jgi:molybdopterin/thiamine biosynthesis adenylyltransferase
VDGIGGKVALVVGTGGLGGPAALVLGAAGVGRLVVADEGAVEDADLAVQPLLAASELGRPRAEAAAARLARLHPALRIEAHAGPVDAAHALALATAADVVVDGSNRFATMFALNDAAVAAGRPLVHGGVLHLSAQLLTIVPGATGCLRCLFEAPPPGSAPAPPSPLAPHAGALLGAEALRLLEGGPGLHAGVLHAYEARSGRARSVPVRRRPGCLACGRLPTARTAA